MEYIIQTNNLMKRYGEQISVDNLNLNIPRGSIYGLLGPNGAGKTTTMKMLLGLVHPTSGDVSVFGKNFTPKNRLEILKNVGSLIESPSYYGHLTAKENLEIACMLKNIDQNEIDEVLKIVQLQGTGKKTVSKFSLGMKQRLGIACALLGRPQVLILDEPTNGLDPAGILEIRELIKSLPEKFGMTILISSHLLSEIDQIVDYVSIMSNGKILFQDSLDVLHQQKDTHLRLRTTNNNKVIELFPKFKLENDYIEMPLLLDKDVEKLNVKLLENNIYILRMEEQTKSLEEIFLSITNSLKTGKGA
ncbi:bacitracin ABC transporter ATP-binding protein [Candidatus Epulonipiscium fishelsonii]|uniref:Bacitracin ABC transporter ATP-binding protein n=1 Tax=Candidatus Epulonipiscium fishelsonii TaxID=77094 RepID=A0ACC8XCW9_9FIRM|nr:bacitracin ABC transporter ATP-binding protein [Epulopiscium sp. SCG-B11WGA-EpuloA1]ONI41847.1 bacitracin ABC transporter ATP-binding protein [Epulopiscium sp. SCG-B05WGA-EpuloA1]